MAQELHFVADEIRRASERYFEQGDYYQAVSEALKAARDKMREVAGAEKATSIFGNDGQNQQYWPDLYGLGVPTALDKDHRRAVGYTHLAVQFFRNELAHQVAHTKYTKDEAISYIALANLAYINVDKATVDDLEKDLKAIQSSMPRWVFYPALETGSWMSELSFAPLSERDQKWLKPQIMEGLSLQKSFDTSNVEFMKLELVGSALELSDLEKVIDGAKNPITSVNQAIGIKEFLRYCSRTFPRLDTPELQDAIQHFENTL